MRKILKLKKLVFLKNAADVESELVGCRHPTKGGGATDEENESGLGTEVMLEMEKVHNAEGGRGNANGNSKKKKCILFKMHFF